MPAPDTDDYLDFELRPPSSVMARAIVLSALARRGLLEILPNDAEAAETDRFDLSAWAEHELSAWIEPAETLVLRSPYQSLTDDAIAVCLDAGESLVALCWSLDMPRAQLTAVDTPVDLPAALEPLPRPWQNPLLMISGARLRPEEEIATERERAELWWWRASLPMDQESAGDIESPLSDVVREALAAGLIDAMGGDFRVGAQPFRLLDEDQCATILTIATARLKAFNWLCGFGASWISAPVDIDEE